ncbi:class I SAM-dependent methyltransferase [Candidatus Thiosymbion oneisti]|nr:methyltransferase domain-containing protein [Candidatus Thiosymbion oneisti]
MHRIREEVAFEHSSRAQVTPGAMAESAPSPIPAAGVEPFAEWPSGPPGNRVEDFLLADDEAFLENAYRRILNRDLDHGGRERFLAKLKAKQISKLEVLAHLRYSPEGRANGVPIRGGLAVRGLMKAVFRVPILGYLPALLIHLIRLPVAVANQERTTEDLWQAINENREIVNKKVDNENFWDVVNGKADNGRLAELESKLAALASEQARLLHKYQDQKRTLLDSQRRLNLLLEEARKRLPEPFDREQVATLAAAADHWLDAHYVSFEDAFRGTRVEIKQRAEVYLELIRAAGAGTEERPVIDLGCGRGELLELLKDHALVARGIDLNQLLVEECRDTGFEVIEADAMDYLRKLHQASIGAITGLHLIEHIPFNQLVQLLDECLRVLKPGGLVAFETPNPENLRVGACHFYFDPTHLHPLPPLMSQFLLEARGYVAVEIKRLSEHRSVESLPLSPAETPDAQALNRVIEFLNANFAAAPDYAVVGYKA